MNLKNNFACGLTIWLLVIVIGDSNSQFINTTDVISSNPNPYTSQLGIQRVLSRRKRYLLFPPGAAFVATMSFAKALATDYPRGVNFVVETDFYYPMYSSISDLFPKDKKPPATTTTAAPTTPVPLPMNPKFDSFPGNYYDPSSVWERTDSNKYRKEYIPLSPNYMYWKAPKPFYKPRYQSYTNYVPKPIYNSPGKYTNKYRDLNWRQRELYRSRRDLYSHIEAAAEKHGFQIKTCIHRMICEGRYYLLPPGVSFFQDVLRILLTLPLTNDEDDGYGKAMQATEDECLSTYSEQCPYSIVGYILHSQSDPNKTTIMHLHKNRQHIAILILTLISIDYHECATTAPSDCVTLSNKLRFQKIYSRKKRYVVFPPGSAVIVTPSVLKALTPVRPSGINLVLEVDFSYPLQTSIAEWYPKEEAEPKIDEEDIEYESEPSPYPSPYPNIEKNQLMQQYVLHRNRRDIIGHIERVASDNGLDIKSCLLRVICEANHYLLPQGQSFFQDVLRILFTTTYKDNVPDEYTNAMKISEDDCAKVYGTQCRYSILGFLLENSK
ncbi:uncharacterized protein LOC119079738 [Bradysia coprophila]|uniref:uncharacterized protein LOC119079738 n=1 Tax=Bradysia coprophila TaxID=38358 RepID=UPI00187D8BF7|nr:uncharacterized protein LOC119079738 [Bradysia coprophila]